MIILYFALLILLLIQIFFVLYFSDKITVEEKYENLKKVVELLLIIVVIFLTCYFMLKNKIEKGGLVGIILFLETFFILFWTFLNLNNNNNNNTINNLNNNNIFSKYIKNNSGNFSFEYLYPNYKKSNEMTADNKSISIADIKKDYSAYNGYPENHICYNCSCLKKDNGSIYCGKAIPGMGMVGCSENWKCRNCKACQKLDKKISNNNFVKKVTNTSNKQYECKNCRCYQTVGGKMCGKKARVTGEIMKCSSVCENCSMCEDSNSNLASNLDVENQEDNSQIVVYPEKNINYGNIIINNISKKDIDNIL